MTYRTRTIPRKPSQRSIRNALQGLDALANNVSPTFEAAPKKRSATGTQKETAYDKANAETASRLYKAVLYRNRRGMVQLPGGGMFPYGLGPNGFGDRVGYTPIVITPSMIGKTLSVFTMIEAKTPEGVVSSEQQRCIEEVRDAGGIAGVARGADDVVTIYQSWRARMVTDER
jgi:hypothetical protein